MAFAEVNGQRLAYDDSGGDGPAVAFSHGLLMDRSMFAPQVRALSDRYRCISWDERGHGETGPAAEEFSYWDSADDLQALLTALGVEQAVLVGMSQGGFLSLRAAIAHPSLVRGLVLIDSQAGLENPDHLPGYQAMLEAWIAQGLSDDAAGAIAYLILGEGWPGTPEWIERWRALPRGGLATTFQALTSRDDLTDRLSEIEVPALVIHGDADASIPLERAQVLADGLPQAELAVIAGAGHASNLTHAEQVNAYIERFLSAL